MPEEQYCVWNLELLWSSIRKPEISNRFCNALGIFGVARNKNVNVGRVARMPVRRDCESAYDEKPDAMELEQIEKLVPIGV